jgi:plastocyanin
MERVPMTKNIIISGFSLLLPSLFFWGVAQAGVVLATPPPAEDPGPAGQSYSPSRFGESPRAPAVAEGRRPAGLTYEDEIPKKLQSHTELKKQAVAVYPQEDTETPKDSAIIPNGQKGVQEQGIIAGDIGYFPKTIFVNPDIPVRLYVTGTSKMTLCFMQDQFQIRKQIKTNEIQEITFTPKTPGTFRFYCPINGMEGTIVVREVASQTLSAAIP